LSVVVIKFSRKIKRTGKVDDVVVWHNSCWLRVCWFC